MSPVMHLQPRRPAQLKPLALAAAAVLWSSAASGQPAASVDAGPAAPESLWTRDRGEDWPQFLGPRRDGTSAERGLDVEAWKSGGPKPLWHLASGEGYGACSVSRGRVFHFDRVDDDNRLRCLRAETGRLLWQFRYPTDYVDHYGYDGGPRCSPLIDGASLYLLDAAGMLHCLRAEDGRVAWKLDTQRKFGVVQNFFGVGSNPVVHGELLILMVGGSPEADRFLPPGQLDRARSNGTAIVAVDKRSGEVRYQFGDELASYASLQLAEIDGRPWGFAFARGGLLAFDPQAGKQRFHFPWRAKILESVNASTPVVRGDEVLISETYGPGAALLRVAPEKPPEAVWKDDDKGRDKSLMTHWNTPVLHDGHVYACSGRHTSGADLRCVRWATGEVKWVRRQWLAPHQQVDPGSPLSLLADRPVTRSSLTLVDGHLICIGEYGELLLIKPSPDRFELAGVAPPPADDDGRPLLRYPCWAAPVVSHGLMWLRGQDRLVCFDLRGRE